MRNRAGKRVQIKRISFQIKKAIISNQDYFHLLSKLRELESGSESLRLIPIHPKINFPNYKNINKTDPRYKTYKIRYLFGPD
jgi:hypothetical protein